MDSNIQGPVAANSLGSIPCARGYQFNFNDTFPKALCKIEATEADPVFVEICADVLVPFNAGTTNVLTVTTDAGGGATLLNGSSVDESVASVQGYTQFVFRANGIISANFAQTGTAATAGTAIIIVRAGGLGIGLDLGHVA